MRGWQTVVLWSIYAMAWAQPALPTISVEVEGVAALTQPRERALREAERHALIQAVETACGVQIAGLEVGRDGELHQVARMAFAQGIVVRWQRVGEPRLANDCVYVRIRAEVVPLAQLRTPDDWSAIWRALGHPPLTLHYQHLGEPMLETPTRDVLQTLLNRALQPIGVHLSPASNPRAWRLVAEVRLQPLKRWGDPDAPYNTGDLFASWRVQMQLRLKPPAGVSLLPLHSPDTPHEPLLLAGEAQAISHLSDMDAIQRALRQILTHDGSHQWQQRLSRWWANALLYGTFSEPPTTVPKKEVATHETTQRANRQSQPAARARRGTARATRR